MVVEMILQKANYSSWVATTFYPQLTAIQSHESNMWTPFISPPCCNTFCNIAASAVQLVYWPTPAPQPYITTVVSGGFTFISPSVYLIYTSLFAFGDNSACGKSQFPTTVTKTIIAYIPNTISSFTKSSRLGTPRQVDNAQLWNNCSSAAAFHVSSFPIPCNNFPKDTYCASLLSVGSSQEAGNYQHCTPNLALPSGLNSMFPEWTTCNIFQYEANPAVVFETPCALVLANAMAGSTPFQTDAAAVTNAAPIPTAPPSGATAPSPSAQKNRGGNDPSSQSLADPQSGDNQSPADPNPDPAPAAPPASTDPAGSTPVNYGQQLQQKWPSQPVANNQGSSPPNNDQSAPPAPPAPLPSPTLQPTTIFGHSIAAAPSLSALLVDNQTVPHGGSTIQIASTPIAFHSNGDLVLGSSTVSSFYTPPPTPDLASQPASLTPSPAEGGGTGSSANPHATAGSDSDSGSGITATLLPNNTVAIAGTTLSPTLPLSPSRVHPCL